MSAPERSSFAVMNSSKSTSSASVIRDVCNLKNRELTVEMAGATGGKPAGRYDVWSSRQEGGTRFSGQYDPVESKQDLGTRSYS